MHTRRKNRTQEYSLAYFTLWWSRMEREASKDIKKKKEERLRHKQAGFYNLILCL